jgi:hypothetical protein
MEKKDKIFKVKHKLSGLLRFKNEYLLNFSIIVIFNILS